MNKLKTMRDIVTDRRAMRAQLVQDPAAVQQVDLRMMRRIHDDPALSMVVSDYADSLSEVIATFPPQLHREFIRQCLTQAVVEWEEVNRIFGEQLKQTPII